MTAPNYLYIIAIALMIIGWGTFAHAEGDSAAGASSTSTASSGSSTALAPDGTPVIHKSLHKKKKTTTAATNTVPDPVASDPMKSVVKPSSTAIITPKPVDSALTVTAKVGQPGIPGLSPTVETGLPVARHSDLSGLAPNPISDSAPSGLGSSSYHPTVVSSLPNMTTPGNAMTATALSGYSTTTTRTTTGNFTFTDYPPKKQSRVYPWKTAIYTTMFYIGEGASAISSTTNYGSSWDQEWTKSNRGADNPDDRNGYASGSHASTVNPFYIALPFNDLVYPDKARQWLPAGWHRPNKEGKPVSACKDRWVEIKAEDGSGHICYAQWEDVGPLRYDHAEYVFGPERPDTATRAGLDVSPAVYEYLGMKNMKRPMTRWRFVDDEDVPPGQWLKLDEQAVIYQAMHHPSANVAPTLPIQRASQPMDDTQDNTAKKKVGAAKG